METCWKPLGIVTSVVSAEFPFQGNPMWFPLGFYTWKQSIRGFHRDSLHYKLGGKLNSQVVSTSFHTWKQSTRKFPFVSLEKPHRKFPGGTSFHTRKQLDLNFTYIHSMENQWKYTSMLFFTRFRDILNFVTFVNFIICNENAIWTLKSITLPYLDD